MDQYIGKMLDNRYEILECIGVGGMAVVYKSRDHRLNRLVAVKILKPELAEDADFRRRFHDESQAVAMLSNINIVSVYDVSHSDGLDYIVMELIEGMTLKQYMQKRGTPLNWREAIHFITQILRALGHAHSRGIVHRDIKPQNILVLRDGSVKVADFGIARVTSAAQATLTQEALGSVHYISPEQAKGSRVDGRSDLYSAGVVLYEMLTGRLPFEGETPVFVAIQHINSIPISPRELNPDIPPRLEAITMKAMAPDPDQRYASAEAMLADLRDFRKNPEGEVQDQQQEEPEELEVEEPTMVVSLSELGAANKAAKEQPVQPRRPAQEAARTERRRERVDSEPAEEEELPARRHSVPPILFAIIVILLFAGGMVYFLYTFLFRGLFQQAEQYTVPSLLGYTVEQLEQNPAILGDFTLEVGTTVYSEEYGEGQICGQTPEGNTTVTDPKTTITVTISGGEESQYMPAVEGQDAKQVLTLLQEEYGLKVRQEHEFSPTVSEGYVISCSLMEGTKVEPGDEVTIVISKGPEDEPVTVIDFLGTDIDQVRDQVARLGLVVGSVTPFHNDKYDVDEVIWQSISPNTQVDAGTVIDFQISLGPEPEPTPSPEPSPSVEPSPDTSSPIVPPSQEVNAPAVTKTITVDLSPYTGMVDVRILVGEREVFHNMVDSSEVEMFTRDVTGTGEKLVSIYVNNTLMESYPLIFE